MRCGVTMPPLATAGNAQAAAMIATAPIRASVLTLPPFAACSDGFRMREGANTPLTPAASPPAGYAPLRQSRSRRDCLAGWRAKSDGLHDHGDLKPSLGLAVSSTRPSFFGHLDGLRLGHVGPDRAGRMESAWAFGSPPGPLLD